VPSRESSSAIASRRLRGEGGNFFLKTLALLRTV